MIIKLLIKAVIGGAAGALIVLWIAKFIEIMPNQ